MKAKNKNIVRIVLGTALILSVPLAAMVFTDEVNWSLFDFVIMGGLLLGTGFMYELITRIFGTRYRTGIALVLAGLFLLIWAELAVGVFGTPFAGD